MRYSEERKQGAYAMLAEHSIAYTSEQLGIPETTLLRWRRQKNAAEAKEQEQESVVECAEEEIAAEESVPDVIPMDEDVVLDEQPEDAIPVSTTQSAIVCRAKALLNADPGTVLSEVSLLIAENENLKTQNQQLRKSLHYLIT